MKAVLSDRERDNPPIERIIKPVVRESLVMRLSIDTGKTMNWDLITTLLSVVSSLIFAAMYFFLGRLMRREKVLFLRGDISNYKEKMKQLSADLARASSEVDKTLLEMETASRVREEALKNLELKLDELSQREKEAQTRIETLENVSLPAAEYFLEMSEKGERRSAKRDYFLFMAGVAVSTIITIILKLVFGI